MAIKDWVQIGSGDEGWAIHADGSLRYEGRVVVPQLVDLREEILREFLFCSTSGWHEDVLRSLSLVLLEWHEDAHWGLCLMMPHVSAGKG